MSTLPTPSFPGALPTIEGTPFAKFVATGDGTHVAARLQCLDLNTLWAEYLALAALHVGPARRIYAVNDSGGALAAGTPVYIHSQATDAGYPDFGLLPVVEAADADYLERFACGVAAAEIAEQAVGLIIVEGVYGPLDTSGYAQAGDPAWLAGGGGLAAAPCMDAPQLVGTVLVKDATNGYLYVKPSDGWLPVLTAGVRLGGLVGSDDFWILATPDWQKCYALYLTILSDTATVGSNAGNKWGFQVRVFGLGVDLFSAARNTHADGELVADGMRMWAFDQNQDLGSGTLPVELQIVKTGNPASLAAAELRAELAYVMLPKAKRAG